MNSIAGSPGDHIPRPARLAVRGAPASRRQSPSDATAPTAIPRGTTCRSTREVDIRINEERRSSQRVGRPSVARHADDRDIAATSTTINPPMTSIRGLSSAGRPPLHA